MSLAFLWTASWQGGMALLLAWVICRTWRTMPARARCWVWRIAYLKLLATLVWTVPLRLPILQPPPPSPIIAPRVIIVSSPKPPPPILTIPATPIPQVHQPWLNRWPTLLLILWSSGVAIAACRLGKHWWWARTLRRRCSRVANDSVHQAARRLADRLGLRATPPILTGESPAGPMLLGIFRPAIILPPSVIDGPPAQLDMVLAHELAHVRRRDLLWDLPPVLADVLFFFHPLVWLGQRELRLAQEMACDHLALAVTRSNPAAYATALLEIAQRGRTPALAFASFVVGPQKSLYTRILAMKTLHTWSRPRLITSAVLSIIIALVTIPPWRVVAQERKTSNADSNASNQKRADEKRGETKAIGAGPVEGAPAVGDAAANLQFIGVLSAAKVQISPAADGVINSVNVRSGDRVKKGDLLLQLDDRRARAGVQVAQAHLGVAKVSLQRVQNLKDAATPPELATQEAELRVAEAELELRVQDLEETRIVAPFDGVVQIRAVAGQRVVKGESLGQLVQEGKLKVEFSVTPGMLREIKTGAQLTLRSVSSHNEFQAKISSISPIVESASGTVAVEAEVIGTPEGLLSGMTVRGVLAAPAK
jgi:RND family efflux transporter MFP subunit